MCLPYLPSAGTLLFWSDLFVVGRAGKGGRLLSWEGGKLGEGSDLGRWKRCVRVVKVVRWQGGKSGRVVR